jgi:hypothetical protein
MGTHSPSARWAERLRLAASLLLALIGTPLFADETRGSLLYENHCTGCHESQVHIREEREVRSEEDLRRFIIRWQAELRLGWSSAEVEDVRQFLGARYYRFSDNP